MRQVRFGPKRKCGENRLHSEASRIVEEAVGSLFEDGIFQGYPGAYLYESVDRVGYLSLALLALEAREEVDMKGFES